MAEERSTPEPKKCTDVLKRLRRLKRLHRLQAREQRRLKKELGALEELIRRYFELGLCRTSLAEKIWTRMVAE